jgi:lipoprotein-releasing system permease protein
MYEYFIAKRYLRSKHKLNFITIISILSTLGITIGVAALIVVLSVFNGFGSLVTSILVNIDPHVRVTAKSLQAFDSIDSVSSYLSEQKNIKTFYPYVEGKVILLNRKTYEILNLKGMPEEKGSDDWGIKTKLISGDYKLNDSNRTPDIILGLPVALKLSCRVQDTIMVSSASTIEKTFTSFAAPATQRFSVSGIYESNNADYDNSYVFTSLSVGQRILGLGNKINGFEIRMNNLDEADNLKDKILSRFGGKDFAVDTWYDLHEDLYSVMLIERWSAYIILCLIIAVATFNLLASLTMSVLEKKKDIGVLRSMGVSSKSILRIFMYEGILVGVIGTIAGSIIGLLICYLQITYNFYPLDPTKYIINALPVEIRISDLIVIAAMALFLSFSAALYPAKRASKLSIVNSIKYE